MKRKNLKLNKGAVSLALAGVVALGTTAGVKVAMNANSNNYWANTNGYWYYIENGSKKTGWLNDKGTWYYLKPDGIMATGWLNDKGTWYFLNNSGAMKTGWLNDRGTWYYLQSSGAMKTGWLNDNGTWYYLYSNGSMAHDTSINGYYLNSSGAWTSSTNSSSNSTSGSRTGQSLIPKLKEIGLTDSRVANTLRYNPGGEKGLDIFTGFNYTAQTSGEYDITVAIERSIEDSDMKLKQMLNIILPTRGNELYSILDTPGLKPQTVYMDGRTIKITINKGIVLFFSPIQ